LVQTISEQLMLGDGLLFGEIPGILTEHVMERLYFRLDVIFEVQMAARLCRREEVKDVDMPVLSSDTVHTSNALENAGRIPGQVIVDDDVGSVQVDTFCQDIGCYQDANIVFL